MRRVVADDIFTDLLDVSLRQVTPIARATLSGLLAMDAGALVNRLVGRAMHSKLAIESGMRQGMHHRHPHSVPVFQRGEAISD